MRKFNFSLVVICFLITKISVYALVPPLSDPPPTWFSSFKEYDVSTLPLGITIDKGVIWNESSIPLYLLSKKVYEIVKINVFPEINPPSDLVPVAKLVSNQIYYPKLVAHKAIYNEYDGEYYEVTRCEQETTHTCLRDWTSHATFNNPSTRYDFRDTGSGRPLDVKIPEPSEFGVLVYYGDKPMYIKGKIVYILNENYEKRPSEISSSYQEANDGTSSNSFGRLFVIVGMIIVCSFILIGGYVVIKRFGKNKE